MKYLVVFLALACASCAYPRRSTSLSPAETRPDTPTPSGVVRILFQGADIPAQDRGGRPWDEDGSGPDSFVRIYRDDTLIYKSDPVEDAIQPEYGFTSPNLYLPQASNTRIELWENDALRQASVIGTWNGRGLPASALRDANASLTLEGRAVLRFRVLAPEAERGVGITDYEVRSDRLLVLSVVRFSPAGRADIRVGDAIVAIGGRSIADLGEYEAASALSMASSRQTSMRISRDGSERDVDIDSGFVWQVR